MSIPNLRVDLTETRGRTAVITMAGELDMVAAPDLYQNAITALEQHPHLILDMVGVTFCDSSGFNALLRLHRRAEEADGRLVLAAPPPQVLRLLTLTGGDTVLSVRGSLTEARAAQPGAEDGPATA